MAAPLSQAPAIELLPPNIRQRVIDMLIDDTSTRKISEWLAERGHKLSFVAIARYKREDLPRHLEIARKLRETQALSTPDSERLASVAEFTNASITADPLLSRVNAKYERYDRWYSQAEAAEDFSALGSIDRAETQALTLHANLTGRLQNAGSSTSVQIAIGINTQNTEEKPLSSQDAPVTIDIQAVRSE